MLRIQEQGGFNRALACTPCLLAGHGEPSKSDAPLQGVCCHEYGSVAGLVFLHMREGYLKTRAGCMKHHTEQPRIEL